MVSKKLVAVALAVAAAFVLPGLASAKKIVFKIATVAPEGTPWASALKRYKKAVWKKTNKQVQVKVFLGGTLGDENETVLACKRGQVQGVGVSTGAMASLVPELNALELPYLFNSAKEADRVLDQPEVMAMVEKLLAERGFTLLFWSENGFRSFGTKEGFIKSPADLSGKKMRAQESPAHLAMYRKFGASPVPVAVTEVLTSLQTGIVDGFDNTPLYSVAASWHTAIKFFSVTNHIYQPAVIAVRKKWFDELPEDIRAQLFEARGTIPQRLKKQLRRMVPMLLKNMAAEGIQVHKLSKKEKCSFASAAAEAHAEFLKDASESTRAFYQLIKSKVRPFCR